MLVSGAIAVTNYALAYITKEVSGTLANPALSWSELLANILFIDRWQDLTVFGAPGKYALYDLNLMYLVIRMAAPILGAIMAAVFFVYQRQLMKEAESLTDGLRTQGGAEVAPSKSR